MRETAKTHRVDHARYANYPCLCPLDPAFPRCVKEMRLTSAN